jgi:hypothetical protein
VQTQYRAICPQTVEQKLCISEDCCAERRKEKSWQQTYTTNRHVMHGYHTRLWWLTHMVPKKHKRRTVSGFRAYSEQKENIIGPKSN